MTVRSRRPGLLVRLVLVTVVAGTIAGVIGAWVLSSSTRATLLDEITDQNTARAGDLAARLDGRVEAQIEMLELIAAGRVIAAVDEFATAELRTALASVPAFDELVLYDATGQAVAAAANVFLADPDDEPPRPDLVERISETSQARLLTGFPPMLEIAAAVSDPPGTVTGVLVARLPFEVVARPALRISSTPSDPVSFIVDADGRIVVHPARDRAMRGEQPLPAAMMAADGSTATVAIDGVDHLVSVAPMDTARVAVVISQVRSLALEPVDEQLRNVTLILTLTMAAVVIAVVATGMWSLAPLAPLVTAVRSLGRNEPGVRVAEGGHGEVGVLASEFNRLAEELDRRQASLAELQRLSLMVNTRRSRESVAAAVVEGVRRLVSADQAAFCSADHGVPEVLATDGSLADGTALEHAADALRINGPYRSGDGDQHYVAVPVPAGDGGRPVGALVAGGSGPIADDELVVLSTYAAFAGVALENAGRLLLEQRLAAELAEAVEHRRRLMGSVSHELRTPLVCIDGFSSTLLDRWDAFSDHERRDLIERIRHHSVELDELVSRLLDFVVTERGTLEATITDVDVAAAVDEVVESMQPVLEGRPLTLDVDEVGARADPVMLRRALTNLLSNAVKYSANGTPIVVRVVHDGRRVRIEVIDEGVGLSADEATQAFEPFWRSNRDSSRAARGAGLGLALVAEYARAMGGNCGVASEPGYGSTFFITLSPLAATLSVD
jgi:signal transduction histidine kinase/HAMP domain-containing protein